MNLIVAITIVAVVIAFTDILVGVMFWKRYRKLADYLASPQVQGSTAPEERAGMERKAQAMRMTAIAMGASAVMIPLMLAVVMALGLIPA